MFETRTRTLLCGDLFTQGGPGAVPITESDILGPSEAFRGQMDYYAHSPDTTAMLERLADERPDVPSAPGEVAGEVPTREAGRARDQASPGRHLNRR